MATYMFSQYENKLGQKRQYFISKEGVGKWAKVNAEVSYLLQSIERPCHRSMLHRT